MLIAEELLRRSDESSLRSSISRAYYGVFCIARNKKDYKNFRLKKGESLHWIVINAYKQSRDRREKEIGRILDNLRRFRNNADYDEDKPIHRGLAERAFLSAKQILTSLESR